MLCLIYMYIGVGAAPHQSTGRQQKVQGEVGMKQLTIRDHCTHAHGFIFSPPLRICSLHKEKVSVYCETCRLCICHECVLWGNSPHKSHNYVRLEVLLQKQTKTCEMEV